MKRMITVALCVGILLGVSTISLADPPSPDWDNHGWSRYRAAPDWHADRYRYERQDYAPPPPRRIIKKRYYDGPPVPYYGRAYDFRPGYRLPPRYLTERYYVNNWYDYQLPSPPPQHRWAYIDGRYILVAITTGIITQILLNGH